MKVVLVITLLSILATVFSEHSQKTIDNWNEISIDSKGYSVDGGERVKFRCNNTEEVRLIIEPDTEFTLACGDGFGESVSLVVYKHAKKFDAIRAGEEWASAGDYRKSATWIRKGSSVEVISRHKSISQDVGVRPDGNGGFVEDSEVIGCSDDLGKALWNSVNGKLESMELSEEETISLQEKYLVKVSQEDVAKCREFNVPYF